MKRSLLFSLITLLLITACQSKKKQAELLEMSKPEWLKSRPVSSSWFYGIGIVPKIGGSAYYEKKVKEKALADLAQQISTKVKSDTRFYKMEDNKGVYEYIQSRINATSNEFLEGYEFVDDWEDESNVYAFYRLSKQTFYTLKAERKTKAMELAWLKLNQAGGQEQQNKVIEALELYATGIDALSGYLNEEVVNEENGEKTDLFVACKDGIQKLLKQLSIRCTKKELTGHTGTTITQGAAHICIKNGSRNAEGLPVKFSYSGGYVVNDKARTDASGEAATPALKYNNKSVEQLKAEIDFVSLSRLVSKNLFVRQMIGKQNKQECLIQVNFN